MLKKTQRISKNQISWVQKKGSRFSNQYLSIKFCLNRENFCRYSVVVSKKIAALATDRNLLRRQLYEIIGQRPAGGQNLDYIIMVNLPLIPLSFTEKKNQLLSALEQISAKNNQ